MILEMIQVHPVRNGAWNKLLLNISLVAHVCLAQFESIGHLYNPVMVSFVFSIPTNGNFIFCWNF